MRRAIALALLPLIAAPLALAAQEGAARARLVQAAASVPDSLRDSLRVVRAARRAQQSFEGARRSQLPIDRSSSLARACDLHVGRYCYWYDESQPPPPAEPASIGRARDKLLAALDSLALLRPGDDWLAGQRVRYRVEAGRADDGVRVAAECRAAPWWCAALSGLALHVSGASVAADSAFEHALALMPPAERCRWTDVSMLLDGRALDRWKRAPKCEGAPSPARDSLAARFWWLARPFLASPANDYRNEQLARRAMARVETMASAGYDVRWGSDTEELMLRFGWPTAWSKHVGAGYVTPATSVVGHEPSPSFQFLPAARLLAFDTVLAREGDWQLRPRAAAARYAPAYLRALVPIGAQLALFRRGDSALVVAGVRVPERDTLLADDSLVVALAVSGGPQQRIAVDEHRGPWRGGALVAHARWSRALASVELLAPTRKAAGRVRLGVVPPPAHGRLAHSDLLFYSVGDSGSVNATPTSLEAALPRVLGSARAPEGHRIGVLWETYGLEPRGEPVSVTLTVERIGVGWAERAAQKVGLRDRANPLDVRWSEAPDPRSGAAFRALALDLSHLGAGRYAVRLTTTARDGARATTTRELELPGR